MKSTVNKDEGKSIQSSLVELKASQVTRGSGGSDVENRYSQYRLHDPINPSVSGGTSGK